MQLSINTLYAFLVSFIEHRITVDIRTWNPRTWNPQTWNPQTWNS